jgi:hypothetical protein
MTESLPSLIHPLVPVCGEHAYLPRHLAAQALSYAAPDSTEEEDVERKLRCSVAVHDTGDHHALVLQLDGPGARAVWTTWVEGQSPARVETRDDCKAISSDARRQPCCEFAGHPGGHTFDMDDPALLE